MSAEWVSAVSEAISALFTVALFILGLYGLNTWSNQVKADHEISRREWARDMLTAVGDLSKHITALRLGRVSPTELLEGSAKLEEIGVYKTTTPAQSVEILDRLMQVLWQTYHRGLTYADSDEELRLRLSEVRKFTSVASSFRAAFCQKHFGKIIYMHTNEGVEGHDETGRDLMKIELTILRPESGYDPFGVRFDEAAESLVRRYSKLATQGR